MAKVTRTCKYCGKEFFAYKRLVNMGEAKYCSRICATTASRGKKVYACSDETKKRMSESRKKYLKENPQTREKHWNWQGGKNKCVDCGKRLSNWYGKRCGPCAAFHRIKIRDPRVKIGGYVTIICDYCGNEHQQKRNNYSPDAKHRFCSKKCEGLWRRINGARGKDHWNYKHGNKSLHLKIRTLPQD